ncbi:acyltransferase [Modestobacter sp. VKM Ac-2983]|uniref:acyltransferase family protein n=1 Tax=Modestobacter sp. VKM Ac-2983 TaxID=3004137 RepID=UPI0022AB6B6C|nr:acyltransferase [Modestobacter sp. VKM Ac-2983]MCZ2806483.1 acyltransferase [Modestobacter sp. VKM Ac-2983]
MVPAAPSAGVRTARLGTLDALRFAAALAVVAFHFTGINPAWDGQAPIEVDVLGRWAAYGAMGVPLFFVISGFVVLMTAWGRDVPSFVASRAGRLFPAYWAAVAIAALFAFVIWPAGSVAGGYAPTRVDALVNLTMLQGGIGTPDLVGAFWTLWTEARFYLLIAVLILIGINRARVLAFATLWPVAGLMAARAESPLLSTLLIADYAPYFAGGMLLYVIYRDGHDLGTWLLVGLQSLLALHFAVDHYPEALAQATGWGTSTTVIAAISLSCFGLVALFVLSPVARLSAQWMTVLGALTYPVYLVHEKVGYYVLHLLRGEVSPWLALAAATAAALLVATLLHHAVEKPFGGRLRAATLRMLQRSTDRATPAAARPDLESVTATGADRAPERATQARPRAVGGLPTHPLAVLHTTASPQRPRHRRPEPRVPVPASARD